MGKPKASKSTMDLTSSSGSSRSIVKSVGNRKSGSVNVTENNVKGRTAQTTTSSINAGRIRLNDGDEMPSMMTTAHSVLQKGNLQRVLEKHGVDNSGGNNSLASAVTSSTASVSAGSTLRSRSNTILSDLVFNNSPDVKSRSNTISSELDLDFVHYAFDTWDLVASSSTHHTIGNTDQQQQEIPTKISNPTIKSMPVPNTRLCSTNVAPLPVPQSNDCSSSIPCISSAQKQLSSTITTNNTMQQIFPVLSSSCEDSVSGFLCHNSNGLLSHTPPLKGTSYEASHFGKRMRSGSVSGRLRSASDLEDLGVIDRNQRNMLKDLIISKHSSRADDELQSVLDQYEKTGDTSGLQRLITEGRLLQQTEAFDLLDDLDLDFLNVGIGNDGRNIGEYDDFERLVDAGTAGLIEGYGQTQRDQPLVNRRSSSNSIPDDGVGELELFDGDHFGGDAVGNATATTNFQAYSHVHQSKLVATAGSLTSLQAGTADMSSYDITSVGEFMGQQTTKNIGEATMQHTTVHRMLPPKKYPTFQDDGIGDIDFNAFTAEDDPGHAVSSKSAPFSQWSSSLPLEELQRRRADSIQMFSSLLGGLPSVDGIAQETYGQWTNETRRTKSENNDLASDSQDSSGEASEVENNCETPRTKLKRGRKKSENTIRKEQEAEHKRKERIRRKEEKEREKLERRAQKERERLEREEKEEKMKEQKRLMKETAALAKLEKQMEVEQKKAEKIKEKFLKEKEKEERKMILKKEMEIMEKQREKDILIPPTPIKPKISKEKEKEEKIFKEKEKEKIEHRRDDPRREEQVEIARKETPSGLGLPRSKSDPNITYRNDEFGLLYVDAPEGWVGAYSPESRKLRIDRFHAKRSHRVWTKTVKYDVRKNFADSRLRVKGRFVKKEDEQLMRDLISLT